MLENGLDFIVSGLTHLKQAEKENIEESEQDRDLKYVLLHLSSGIELFLKVYKY